MVSRVYQICHWYESGYGHGIKNDGLDLSKTEFADAESGEAYQIGYDAGLEKFRRHANGKEPSIPDGDKLPPTAELDIDPANACNRSDPECEACQ